MRIDSHVPLQTPVRTMSIHVSMESCVQNHCDSINDVLKTVAKIRMSLPLFFIFFFGWGTEQK